MIVYQNGKKAEKALDEMTLSELDEVDFDLLTEEEKEEWGNRFKEAPFAYY